MSRKKHWFLLVAGIVVCLIFFVNLFKTNSNEPVEIEPEVIPEKVIYLVPTPDENSVPESSSSSGLIRLGQYRVQANNEPKAEPTPTPTKLQNLFAKLKTFL